MFITLEADYAVRIIDCMAQSKKRQDAKTIADKTGVSLRFALKILRKLVGAELVVSYKGATGGYEMKKAPEETTLREVIEAIDGPYYISRCAGGTEYTCSHPNESCCRFQKTFFDISQTVKNELEKQTGAR